MARRTYTDRDRALVYAELAVNDGNIKRTARNLGMTTTTVRRWRDDWETNGIPDSVVEEVEVLTSDFLPEAIRIRGKLLIRLESLVDNDKISSREVVAAINVLSDKIRAYEALEQVQRVEHTLALPSTEEIKELFAGMVSGVVSAAKQRAAEIEAYEEPLAITTYSELPVSSDSGGSTP